MILFDVTEEETILFHSATNFKGSCKGIIINSSAELVVYSNFSVSVQNTLFHQYMILLREFDG